MLIHFSSLNAITNACMCRSTLLTIESCASGSCPAGKLYIYSIEWLTGWGLASPTMANLPVESPRIQRSSVPWAGCQLVFSIHQNSRKVGFNTNEGILSLQPQGLLFPSGLSVHSIQNVTHGSSLHPYPAHCSQVLALNSKTKPQKTFMVFLSVV